MAVLGNISKMDTLGDFSARFALAARLLELGAQADAYLIFSALSREQPMHAALNYNVALCYAAAGHWEPCLMALERALGELSRLGVDPAVRDSTYRVLLGRQRAGRSYLFPMIDGCAALRLTDQFELALAQLTHDGYANVRRAVELMEPAAGAN